MQPAARQSSESPQQQFPGHDIATLAIFAGYEPGPALSATSQYFRPQIATRLPAPQAQSGSSLVSFPLRAPIEPSQASHAADSEVEQSEGRREPESRRSALVEAAIHKQSKLDVHPSDDPDEREANTMAAGVVETEGMNPATTKGSAEGDPELNDNPDAAVPSGTVNDEDQDRLRRFGSNGSTSAAASADAVQQALQIPLESSGQPLDKQVRTNMEPRFGHDFSRVRIHADSAAAEAADAIQARAYAVRHHIVFGAGEYAPHTSPGRQLLAHELTHVVQADRAPTSAGRLISQVGDTAEREAEHAASDVTATGQPQVRVSATPAAQIHREPPTPATLAAAQGQPDPNAATAPKPPDAGPDVVDYRGVQLSSSPEFVAFQLKKYITEHENGENSARQFVDEFAGHVEGLSRDIAQEKANQEDRNKPGGSDVSGAPKDVAAMEADYNRKSKVVPVVREQMDKISGEAANLLRTFHDVAIKTMTELMDESEKRANAELEHYGITRGVHQGKATYTGARNKDSGGLVKAAKEIRLKHKEIASVRNFVWQLGVRKNNAEVSPQTSKWDSADDAILKEETEKVSQLEMDMMMLRIRLEDQYPILARYSEDTDRLDNFIHDAENGHLATVLGQEIDDKLANISKVRAGLGTTYPVWTLPRIVETTKQTMPGVQGNPFYNRLIDDKARAEMAGKELATEIIDAVGFVFLIMLIIPVTRPIGIVGGAATGLLSAAVNLRENQLKAAASGTDFDKARAISAESPSEFWLAVQLVMLIPDIGQALKVFRSLAPAARTMVLTKDATEFTAVATREAPEHADKLAARAQQQVGASSSPIIGPSAGSAARRASLLREIKTNLKNYWARLTGGRIAALNEAVNAPDMNTARVIYEDMIAKTPGREAGIWHNPLTGEIVVVQGEGNWVGGSVNLPNTTERWIIIEHFHPERNFAVQFASEADWNVLLWGHGGINNVRQRVQSTIRWINPKTGRYHVSHFGYDPALVNSPVGPYFLNIETATGARVDLSFRNFTEYRAQLARLRPGMDVPG